MAISAHQSPDHETQVDANKGSAKNMVDKMFWNRRKVEKYNNPMVNLDLT